MTWFKVATTILTDDKLFAVDGEAFRALFMGLAYCAEHLTDGHIPKRAQRLVGSDDAMAQLVAEGLIEETEGGWLIPKYLEHQRSRDQVMAERKAARDRQARRRKRTNGGSHAVTPPVSPPVGNGAGSVTEESRGEEIPPKAPRPSDALRDALADGVGAWSRKQRASAKLREAATELGRRGVEPEQVPQFFERWPIAFPDAHPPTDPTKIVQHWSTVMDAKVTTLDSRRATARPVGQGPDCEECNDSGFVFDLERNEAVQCPECKRGLDA